MRYGKQTWTWPDWRRRARFSFWAIARRLSSPSHCPSCADQRGANVGRSKFLFLARRCSGCGLVYRIPVRLIPRYYEEKSYHGDWYEELQRGDLRKLMEKGFHDSKWDYYDKLSLVTAAKSGGRLLDFGAGSGILSWQLQQLGFRVTLFEVNPQMKMISEGLLGLEVWSALDALERAPDRSFDVLFSHHVLEHIEDLRPVMATFHRLLKDDGLLALFVPNAGSRTWNGNLAGTLDSAHISAFEAVYFHRNLARFGFEGRTFSMPYCFAESGPNAEATKRAEGPELALFAWKLGQPAPAALAQWPYRLPNLENSERAQAGC